MSACPKRPHNEGLDHNYSLMAVCIYCGRSAFQDGNEAFASHSTQEAFNAHRTQEALRRPKAVDPLTPLTCMWCALPFPDITTLEEHEDAC